jgi:hypothetical protein
MSFSNIEMIHLYIYFKQENAKKNLYFSVAVFFAVFVLRKTQLWENYYSRRNASSEVTHIGKTVSSDVSGNYLFRLPSGNAKIFVSCIGFQPVDTLVNIAFDQVLNFILENTVQLQEVVIRQKSIH